ncbi:MAG: non-hydrolyzing UDP-N-acetylglucosamine 2-epimerase [Thermoleophilia bacterium]
MKKIKIMTLVGTRPELIRLSRVIALLDREADHVLVHTGQNHDYELNEIFFKDLEIRKPDHFLEAAGANAAETIGNTISKIDPVLAKEEPEAFLVLGDTNSCLAAIAAKRRKIPIFHMEAGNRCFDQRVPEETNRKIVDHISDINLTYSDIAREYLLREGLPADRIIKTGSPMFEVLSHYRNKIDSSGILKELKLTAQEYFVVSAHREENIESESNFRKLVEILNKLAEIRGKRIIVSAHPRTRKRVESLGVRLHEKVELLKPLGFTDYVHLQIHSLAVLSDSGTITEESSILNFPALNIREAHERPEGMEETSVMLTGLELGRVLQGLEILKKQPRGEKRLLRQVADYSLPNVSEKMLRIILSYTDYVNRIIWKKQC